MSLQLRWAVTGVLVLMGLGGCVGRELVGVTGSGGEITCMDPTPCSLLNETAPEEPIDPREFELTPLRCEVQMPTPGACDRLFTDSAVGIVTGCDDTISLGPSTFFGMELSCARITLELEAGAVVELRDSVIRDTEIELRGGPGSVLRLVGSQGDRVRLRSFGQAWIEVLESNTFDDLQVLVDERVEGRAVLFSESSIRGLAVRTGLRGTVRFERTSAAEGAIDVGELIADESTFFDVDLKADHALLAVAGFEQAQLWLGAGTIVSGALLDSTVHRCGALRLVEASMELSHLRACDTPTEFVGGSVVDSTVRGGVVTDGSAFISSVFAGGPEELRFGSSLVNMSTFCGETHVVGNGGSILCAGCEPEVRSAMLEGTVVSAPQCPSLEAAAPPESRR
ncbi:MAG: hypothetical protein AAGF12_15525 [Myxococcota bacterium]